MSKSGDGKRCLGVLGYDGWGGGVGIGSDMIPGVVNYLYCIGCLVLQIDTLNMNFLNRHVRNHNTRSSL